jgi:hypothetical protein
VTDTSESGSPLKVSGTASFTEEIARNAVTFSGDYKVDARNVSDKGIILVLAEFDEGGPHGAKRRHVIQLDHFFWDEIASGQSFVLARGDPAKRVPGCCETPLTPAAEPTAEIRVRYIQFADGSTYGDDRTAENALRLRSAIREALVLLDNIGNDQEFLSLLAQRTKTEDVDDFLDSMRHTVKTHGTATARKQVHTAVTAAANHAAAMRSVRAER